MLSTFWSYWGALWLALLAALPLRAEIVTDLAPFTWDSDRPGVLVFEGEITRRTPPLLGLALGRFAGVEVLELASPGGDAYAAMAMVPTIRAAGLATRIAAGDRCHSACSFLYFAGVDRAAEGELGVHQLASGNEASGHFIMNDVLDVFSDLGLPDMVRRRMMQTPPDQMYVFSPQELVALGLVGPAVPSAVPPVAAPPVAAPPEPDETAHAERPSQEAIEAGLPDWAGPPAQATAEYLEMVDKLRAATEDRPDEIEGQELLAKHEGALGNYRAAQRAAGRVIALKGEAATADDYTKYTDLLVLAAEGRVSPEAEAAARKALALDPDDGIALYYLGLMYGQNDRPDLGFPIWRDLIERSHAGDPWVEPIRGQIGQLAAMAGVDYTLPGLVAPDPVVAALVPTPRSAPDPTPDPSANLPATHIALDIAGQANGRVVIALYDDIAPEHTARLVRLAREGAYDNVVFHRVIDGFMAQTGDVEFGKAGGDLTRAGTGGSSYPDLPAEFSDRPFEAGTVGMARALDPDSANAQFFIMFGPAPHLAGQYTVVGRVVEGLDVVNAIKRGGGGNGAVTEAPDRIVRAAALANGVEQSSQALAVEPGSPKVAAETPPLREGFDIRFDFTDPDTTTLTIGWTLRDEFAGLVNCDNGTLRPLDDGYSQCVNIAGEVSDLLLEVDRTAVLSLTRASDGSRAFALDPARFLATVAPSAETVAQLGDRRFTLTVEATQIVETSGRVGADATTATLDLTLKQIVDAPERLPASFTARFF